MNVILIDLGSNRIELNEPIGLESIAGTLLNNFKDINLVFKWGLLESTDVSIIKNNYDIFGISAKLGTYTQLKSILNSLIEERKQKKVIIGGPLATFGYIELLYEFPDVICVRGEGEYVFSEIYKKILDNNTLEFNTLEKIPNLVFNKNNCIIQTERIVENLNVICRPYRYYLNEILNQKGIVRIESSRGCAWSKCDFCSVCEHYGSKFWRPFPINYIIEEMEFLSKEGCLAPYFTDEDFFGSDYERSKELANQIIKAKKEKRINPEMNFFFSARINDLLQPYGFELLKLWKIAGLRELFIGLESGVQNQLKRYGKAATPKRNSMVIKLLKDLDIQLDIGYILFDPEMNFNELVENIKYIENEHISSFDSRSLKYLRSQPFTNLSKKYFEKKIVIGELNIDLLYYPIRYNDENVSKVMMLYEKWEEILKNRVYFIQATSRGEIFSEQYRIYLKERLSIIRVFDFNVLKKIVDFVLNNVTFNELMEYQQISEREKIKVLDNITIK